MSSSVSLSRCLCFLSACITCVGGGSRCLYVRVWSCCAVSCLHPPTPSPTFTACAYLPFLAILMPFVIWPCWCVGCPPFGLPRRRARRVFIFMFFVCLRVALWLPLPGQYFYFQEVLPVLAAKHCIMQANAELHQSILAKQKKRFGEEIARLQVKDLIDTTRKRKVRMTVIKLIVNPAACGRAGEDCCISLRRIREREGPDRQDQPSPHCSQERQRLHLPRPRSRGQRPGANRQGGAC